MVGSSLGPLVAFLENCGESFNFLGPGARKRKKSPRKGGKNPKNQKNDRFPPFFGLGFLGEKISPPEYPRWVLFASIAHGMSPRVKFNSSRKSF